MDLTRHHLDLLRVVHELEQPDRHPGTKAAGQGLLAVWQERGGPYFWQAAPPWQGTDPYAGELRDAGLLEVHPGIAKYRRPEEPIESVQEYWLSLTDAGRARLADTT